MMSDLDAEPEARRFEKAVVVRHYGGSDQLEMNEIEVRRPAAGEALVKNVFAGVNFADIYRRRGDDPQPLPLVLGLEGAGLVEAVGQGVTNVRPGDRVAYARHPGSYALASLIPAEYLIALPDDMPFETGAAFPLQGLTAHYLIHEFRKPTDGDVVLIHAAAGGVGLLLVQWARHLGARVIGTVSTEEKAQAALEAGAHDVILYTEQDFAVETKRLTNGNGADLIIDGVGKTTFRGNLEAAAELGHIVLFGAASGQVDPISPNILMGRSLTISGADLVHFIRSPAEMHRRASAVMDGIRAGWLVPRISRILPLEDAATAHNLLEDRRTIGKILLAVG
jgi:NADPH2:quinone reductase